MEQNTVLLAIQAYKEVCDNHATVYNRKGNAIQPLVYQAPSYSSSIIGRKYVYLYNCNGELARYNIKTGEITVWLFEAREWSCAFFMKNSNKFLLLQKILFLKWILYHRSPTNRINNKATTHGVMARYAWGSKRPLQAIKVVILSANSPFDAAKISIFSVIFQTFIRLFAVFSALFSPQCVFIPKDFTIFDFVLDTFARK